MSTTNEPVGASGASDDAQARRRLQEILARHETAMLLNHDADGKLCGRPMQRARLDDDATMYFATSIESEKVAQMKEDPSVTLSLQGGREFAFVHGVARISQDKALVDQLWSEAWKVWFPQGKDDPTIAIVIVEPREATYWDNSKAQGLSFLARAAKAIVTGEEMSYDPGDTQTVPLGSARGQRA